MPTGTYANRPLAEKILAAFDTISGLHPGFRPVHAKGRMCTGTLTPSSEAAKLTRAPHGSRPTTPITVRFSDAPGVPTTPDPLTELRSDIYLLSGRRRRAAKA